MSDVPMLQNSMNRFTEAPGCQKNESRVQDIPLYYRTDVYKQGVHDWTEACRMTRGFYKRRADSMEPDTRWDVTEDVTA